jgi:hypothetical protein
MSEKTPSVTIDCAGNRIRVSPGPGHYTLGIFDKEDEAQFLTNLKRSDLRAIVSACDSMLKLTRPE